MILSILVPTMPKREWMLAGIVRELERQAVRHDDVEVLVLRDNLRMNLGSKRNKLISIAAGKYVSFVDDDDRVSPDYVDEIVHAVKTSPDVDVVCFLAEVSGHSPTPFVTRFHPTNTNQETPNKRLPNHLCAWRKELAASVKYRTDVLYGEDVEWPIMTAPLIKTHVSIEKVLYYYDFDPKNSFSAVVSNVQPPRRRDRHR